MKDILIDVVRQVAPLFEHVRVSGTDAITKVEAYTDDKNLFLVANLKEPVPDFEGEFGIGSLSLLNGLLGFASYKTDEAKFAIHRAKRDDGGDYVSEFEFRDRSKAGTKFKTMNPRMVGEQAKIASIVWDMTITPTKAKITEIAQLASMLSEVDKMFGLKVEDGTLFLTIGGKSEVTHAATVALAEDVESKLLNSNNWLYNTAQFLSILKNASNAECKVNFCSRGVIGITVETDKAIYTFYIRGKQG